MITKNSVKKAFTKTFNNPITYIGAAAIGVLSFITTDYHWGYLTPFFVFLIVQLFTLCLSEEATAQEREKLNQKYMKIGD
jgi:hypothetical protein